MQDINARVVHRSNHLLGWNPAMHYGEAMTVPNRIAGEQWNRGKPSRKCEREMGESDCA